MAGDYDAFVVKVHPINMPSTSLASPIQPSASTGDRLSFPLTGHSVACGFKTFWEQNCGLLAFGYSLTEELTDSETGMTVQYFERAVSEYHSDNRDPYKILLRRIGADELRARGW